LVETHFQRGDAGPLDFASLEFGEPLPAIGVDRAEAVELGVKTGGDDAAVVEGQRSIRVQGRGEKVAQFAQAAESRTPFAKEARQVIASGRHGPFDITGVGGWREVRRRI